MSSFIDITDNRYGNLVVIGRDESKHGKSNKVWWKCRCDCGNIKITTADRLRSGQTKSCGCIKIGSHSKDISNRQFGRLTALYIKGINKHHQNVWHCICECGNEVDVTTTKLLQNKTRSCGCLAKEITSRNSVKDLTDKQFGNLTVICRDYSKQSTSRLVYWKCRCKCGNIVFVIGSTLRNCDTTSCGCISTNFAGSRNENEIKDFILSLLPDAKIEKSKILNGKEIDIYLPELKLGIEYNGSAFHSINNIFRKDIDKYYHQKKFLLAKSMGIRLLTIFDIDYEGYKNDILLYIKNIIIKNEKHFIPTKEFIYTSNDYDDGEWLRKYGYIPIKQLEPIPYVYKNRFTVYRSGATLWKIPR